MTVRPLLTGAVVVLLAGCGGAGSSARAPSTSAGGTGNSTTSAAPAATLAGSPASTACGQPSAAGATAGSGGKEANPPGDIPDNQAFVTYQPPSQPYAVKVPEGWARTDGPRGVSFTDKLNTIRIDVTPAASAPTVASAKAEEVPALSSAAACFRLVDVSTVTRPAGAAVLIRYQARGPADPVTGKSRLDDVERYEFWRTGTEVSLTLSGPVGSDNVDPWKTVTGSFRWQ